MRGAGGRVADFGGDEVPELVFVRFDGGGELVHVISKHIGDRDKAMGD